MIVSFLKEQENIRNAVRLIDFLHLPPSETVWTITQLYQLVLYAVRKNKRE